MKKHNYIENVLVRQPHIQSRAAYVKLCRYLRKRDVTENFALNLGFRKKFLTQRLQEQGELVCEYCGKRPLILNPEGVSGNVRKLMLATLDHIRAKSQGGSWYLSQNIKVACPQCNQKKDSLNILEFNDLLQKMG